MIDVQVVYSQAAQGLMASASSSGLFDVDLRVIRYPAHEHIYVQHGSAPQDQVLLQLM